ncbi:MAG TPA: TonB-dependent receptor [Gemmatimonadaceae bacterium]
MTNHVLLRQFLCVAAIIAATVLNPLPSDAQQPDSAARLPAVTVTATRGEQAIVRVPLALTRIGTPQLRAVSGYGLDEGLKFVPGVVAQSRYGTSDVRLMIRGFGARGAGDRSNAGTSRGIRILLDGMPETEPDGRTSFDQIDLASASAVEVIRSNASAVWGNAAGGVVNLLSVPEGNARTLDLEPIFGSFGLKRYAVRAATPFGDGVGFVNFTNTTFDGWRAHSSARRSLLNFGTQGNLGRARIGFYASGANNLFRIPGPLTRAEADSSPRQANATYAARDERRYNRIARVGTTVDYAFDSDRSRSLSGMVFVSPKYLERSERGTYRDFNRYHVGGNIVGRAALPIGTARSTLTVGADEAYQSGSILFYSLTPEGTRGTTLRDNKAEGANNLGIFGQDELWLSDRLGITAGARYDNITYYYKSFINPRLDTDKAFKRVSPKVGVVLMTGADRSIYANVGGGIEAPAGNETDPAPTLGLDTVYAINPLLDAIRSTTYEIGYKAINATIGTLPLTASYDVAFYTTDVRNEIVPYAGGRFYFTAGRARRSGAELGLNLESRAGVFARSALTLSRNRYVDYIVDSVHYGRPGHFADYGDNDIVGIPSVTFNGELGTTVPGIHALRVKGEVEHTGKYFADDANTVNVPAYTLFDVGLELRNGAFTTGGWGVSGFATVRNVADKRHIASAFLNPDRVNGVPVAFEPGTPRSLVVGITVAPVK